MHLLQVEVQTPDIDVTSTLNLGSGDLNITLGNVSSGDSNNVHLGLATINANNITLTDSGTGSNTSRVSVLGDLNASSAINVTSTNKRVNVGSAINSEWHWNSC